jgi:tRNA-specific 2-thiouridylase
MKSQDDGKAGIVKVFVGVSGGVDSSVALALLQSATPKNHKLLLGVPAPRGFKKYDVTGVFIKTWSPEWLPCSWPEERRSAMRVCAKLGVPFVTLDCVEEYKRDVADYMINEYAAGRVPNPDVFCNKYVKFGAFLEKALAAGADFVATGHYARVVANSKHQVARKNSDSESLLLATNYLLLESTDKNKDQSYFLYTLDQHQLSHTLFPIGHLTKPEVRKLAEKFGLPTANKKDSQGLCFIGKVDIKDFLNHYIKTKQGDVLNTAGEKIGRHDGALLYTIGERHGFTITKKSPSEGANFIVAKDLGENTLTVASSKEQAARGNAKEIVIKNLHWISGESEFQNSFSAGVRIRYRQELQKCTVSKKTDGWHVVFGEPQIGVAEGQSAVLYDGEVCLGGGVIEKVASS